MSVYMTEEEQLRVIKSWWQRYNNVITVVLSLVLLTVAGFKYWHWHQDKVTQQASNAFEQLMMAFSNKDNKGIKSYANQLIKEYPDTVYADAAHMTLAKVYAMTGKYQKAQEQLQFVASHSKMLAIKQVAKLRMVRILVAEKSYDKALTALTQVDDLAYMPVVNELKGDIYLAQGSYQKAFDAYRQAIVEVRTHGIGNPFLEMKTNELAALNQTTSVTQKVRAA